jgi:hypothetical protein
VKPRLGMLRDCIWHAETRVAFRGPQHASPKEATGFSALPGRFWTAAGEGWPDGRDQRSDKGPSVPAHA